ncbi:MAG: hypothetical protein RIQ72_54 [Candidatus Parcubacteria bacterium]
MQSNHQSNKPSKIEKGVISINTRGKGFVRLESRAKLGRDGDVPVQPEDIGGAFQGDTVEVELYSGYRDQEYAAILHVVEQKKNAFVGTLISDQSNPELYFFQPDDTRANVLVQLNKALIDKQIATTAPQFTNPDGTLTVSASTLKVKVALGDWIRLPHQVSRQAREEKRNRDRAMRDEEQAGTNNSQGPVDPLANLSTARLAHGTLVSVIGQKGLNNTEMEAIVMERGFDTTFPQVVVQSAEQSAAEYSQITDTELTKRRDLRHTFTCTIDPFDAKDFDDALSIRPTTEAEQTQFPGAAYEIGVHIADVSHFVREDIPLDDEAKKRAFSVYLVDRTIPMLPSILSNGACSLNPHEDRFAFSAIFIVNKDGDILNRWFGKTVIHSDKRFTYENAQEILTSHLDIDCKSEEISKLPWTDINIPEASRKDPFARELLEMNRIAKIYLKAKKEHGAIDFETTEIKFKLDEAGVPIEVYKKARVDTHRLVEEYMLLANREVAKFIQEKNKVGAQERPGVYRVHDKPDPDRIRELALYVKALGFDFPIDEKNANKITPKQVQKLLLDVAGTPQETMIKISTLRSMAKAIYATHDLGHFGLAYDHYTHFTSPIRRYPDLMVHRVLQMILDGKVVATQNAAQFEKICADSTTREIEAADAERSSIKYKQVEYMLPKVGQEFDVTISGISDFGMFVQEPEAMAEGLIRLKDLLPVDFYTVDAKNFKIIGEKTKKEFHIGDTLHVKLAGADLENKALNFVIL